MKGQHSAHACRVGRHGRRGKATAWQLANVLLAVEGVAAAIRQGADVVIVLVEERPTNIAELG